MDNVHAHAPPGDLVHLFGGAESRGENEMVDLGVAQRLVRGHQAALPRPRQDGRRVQASSVVGNLEQNLTAFPSGLQPDVSRRRLPESSALFGEFDAVGQGIAQQMLERRDHAVQHQAVEFGLPPLICKVACFPTASAV